MEPYLLSYHALRSALLLAIFLVFTFENAALCEEPKVKMPSRPPAPARQAKAPAYREDVLLVMPQRGTDAKEVKEIFKDIHGEILETIGEGELTCYVIKVEKGKLIECERKLGQDKHFSAVQRDYVFQAN